MSKKFTFLFVPIDAVGHFNASIGVGQQLLARGHKIVFATPNSWKGKLEVLGFIEELTQADEAGASTENWGEIVAAMRPALMLPALQQVEIFVPAMYSEAINKIKTTDKQLREIMAAVEPDLVVIDHMVQTPAIMNQGVPWITLMSLNPLGISPENVPPAFSGYPCIDNDENRWVIHRKRCEEAFKDSFKEFKSWVVENGGPVNLPWRFPMWQEDSPYGNMYMYPVELDYTVRRPCPPNWHRFDSFMRFESGAFEIPQELNALPGKLIYFSMGTIGSSEITLMQKLIQILSKSPHRFIVSKGPLGDELTLGKNMWGKKVLAQTQVLPMVDLVITHGGNNTITESFFFGKRVIVLPLMIDQLDNGQRIEETGLGIQFQPYHVTEEQLLQGIEDILEDEILERRMNSIGKRIQAARNQESAAIYVEQVAQNYA